MVMKPERIAAYAERVKAAKQDSKWWSLREVETLIAACPTAPRMQTVIALMWDTGWPGSTLSRLNVGDLRPLDGTRMMEIVMPLPEKWQSDEAGVSQIVAKRPSGTRTYWRLKLEAWIEDGTKHVVFGRFKTREEAVDAKCEWRRKNFPYTRTIRWSVPHVERYLAGHPLADNPDSPLLFECEPNNPYPVDEDATLEEVEKRRADHKHFPRNFYELKARMGRTHDPRTLASLRQVAHVTRTKVHRVDTDGRVKHGERRGGKRRGGGGSK